MQTQTADHISIEAARATTAPPQFTPLAQVTNPTVDTAAAGYYLHLAQNTLRIYACRENGPIRPLRIPGSSKLHWRTADIRKLLGVS